MVVARGSFEHAASQPPRYSAAATVMVRSGFAVDPLRQGAVTTTPEEEGQFLSQMELAKSTLAVRKVAARLTEEDRAALLSGGEQSLLDKAMAGLELASLDVTFADRGW